MEYKGYRITRLPTWPGFVIQAKGKGTIPNVLQGEYTTEKDAMKQIDISYSMLMKGKRRTANVKESSSSTD